MSVPREATLYIEKANNQAADPLVLTKGSTVRSPDASLKNGVVDMFAGKFWVEKLPELGGANEALLEFSATSYIGRSPNEVEMPYPFKLEAKIANRSFSSNIAKTRMLRNVVLGNTGFECRVALVEIDKLNENKLKLITKFINDTKIADAVNPFLRAAGMPTDVKQVVDVVSKSLTLLDELNEDDVVWRERPTFDLRAGAGAPIYEGWYAFVMTPKNGRGQLPNDLYFSGGKLYKEFKSSTDNVPFEEQTYLTWQIVRAENPTTPASAKKRG